MFEGFRTVRGIIRSLRIYYGDRSRATAMDRLHAEFVRRGDLVFDIGAHVGDRVASFRQLGRGARFAERLCRLAPRQRVAILQLLDEVEHVDGSGGRPRGWHDLFDDQRR